MFSSFIGRSLSNTRWLHNGSFRNNHVELRIMQPRNEVYDAGQFFGFSFSQSPGHTKPRGSVGRVWNRNEEAGNSTASANMAGKADPPPAIHHRQEHPVEDRPDGNGIPLLTGKQPRGDGTGQSPAAEPVADRSLSPPYPGSVVSLSGPARGHTPLVIGPFAFGLCSSILKEAWLQGYPPAR